MSWKPPSIVFIPVHPRVSPANKFPEVHGDTLEFRSKPKRARGGYFREFLIKIISMNGFRKVRDGRRAT